WRVASDLNWRRLKYWRRLITQTLDEASAPGAAEMVSEVLVEHGPHAVVQGWMLVSWLSRYLGWRFQAGRVTPGVEMAWRFLTSRGEAQVRIRRLDKGPAEILGVRLASTLDGKPVSLNISVEGGTEGTGFGGGSQRLRLQLAGVDASPRTMTVPPQTAVEL